MSMALANALKSIRRYDAVQHQFSQVKQNRNNRIKQTAEVFTPIPLVNEMLDKLEDYNPTAFLIPSFTFIDPACGNGNMLIVVLERKLKHSTPLEAISTIFGCDIMADNIEECKNRLLQVIIDSNKEYNLDIINEWLRRNIVCTPLDIYPNGSLDYLRLPADQTFN